jgi:hypothetical protein
LALFGIEGRRNCFVLEKKFHQHFLGVDLEIGGQEAAP